MMIGLDATDAMHNEHYQFQFVGGNLALDFVNTVAFRSDGARTQDHLQRAEDVGRWARQARLPDLLAIQSVAKAGTVALRHIREVREQLFAAFHAIASGDPIPSLALASIGSALNDCCAKRRLSADGNKVQWAWRASARPADRLLFPILTTATELLTSPSRPLIRQCEDADCGWLFLDRSNARKRRWCSMADCGNRNKARKFYRREAGLINVDD